MTARIFSFGRLKEVREESCVLSDEHRVAQLVIDISDIDQQIQTMESDLHALRVLRNAKRATADYITRRIEKGASRV